MERWQERLYERQDCVCVRRGQYFCHCIVVGNGAGEVADLVYWTDDLLYAVTVF